MTKDWYSPASINFSRENCIWIILNYDSLSRGIYPPECKESGYAGKTKGGINKHAHFENPCLLSGEISYRLRVTKTDGKLLKAQIQGGITDYELLEPEAQMALNFISLWDWRKRKTTYAQWKAKRGYYFKRRAGQR